MFENDMLASNEAINSLSPPSLWISLLIWGKRSSTLSISSILSFRVYLFQPLLNSFCWLCRPWRPRCRCCGELQASDRSACTRCCHVPRGCLSWSPRQTRSSACNPRLRPGLDPMTTWRCPPLLQWRPGWSEHQCLSRKRSNSISKIISSG